MRWLLLFNVFFAAVMHFVLLLRFSGDEDNMEDAVVDNMKVWLGMCSKGPMLYGDDVGIIRRRSTDLLTRWLPS